MYRCAFFCLLFLFSCAHAVEKQPKDVTEFLINADSCQHLAGEWDSSLPEAQKRDIEKQVDAVCMKAKIQQNELRNRYHDEQSILDVIDAYDF